MFVLVIKFHVKYSDKKVNRLNLNQKEVIYLNFNVIKIFIKSNLKPKCKELRFKLSGNYLFHCWLSINTQRVFQLINCLHENKIIFHLNKFIIKSYLITLNLTFKLIKFKL